MCRRTLLIILTFSICSPVCAATDSKARLIALQGASENFICKLSEKRTADVRDLKRQVIKTLADRGYSNAVVDINFWGSLHTAMMSIDHDEFRIDVQAENGKLTSTNLYVK